MSNNLLNLTHSLSLTELRFYKNRFCRFYRKKHFTVLLMLKMKTVFFFFVTLVVCSFCLKKSNSSYERRGLFYTERPNISDVGFGYYGCSFRFIFKLSMTTVKLILRVCDFRFIHDLVLSINLMEWK